MKDRRLLRERFIRECLVWTVFFSFVLGFLLGTGVAQAQNHGWFTGPLNSGNEIVEIAKTQVGVRERSGNNDGFDVEKYLATTSLGPGYAWCAAFVNWTMIQSGADHPAELAAWSPSWFPSERTFWQLGISEYLPPQPGDVFGIYFNSKQRIAHVGLIEHWHGHYATTIEGNTNNEGSREGDGVYRKRRLKKQVSSVSRWRGNGTN